MVTNTYLQTEARRLLVSSFGELNNNASIVVGLRKEQTTSTSDYFKVQIVCPLDTMELIFRHCGFHANLAVFP